MEGVSRYKKNSGDSPISTATSSGTNDLSAEWFSRFAKPAKSERAADLRPVTADAAKRFGRTQTGRLALRTRGRVVFIDPVEVSAIEAQGNSSLVRAASGPYQVRQSISDIAERLRPYGVHPNPSLNGGERRIC